MKVDAIVLGGFETNSYVVRASEEACDCVVIDTGLSAEPLIDFLSEHKLNPVVVIFTHGHADHIAGLNLLREKWSDIKVAIHTDDAGMLTNPMANLSVMTGVSFSAEAAEIVIAEEGVVEFAGMSFEVFHTPGHTPGGICLYCRGEGVVFAGDALFASSIGRTDFPGGNYEQLIESIKSKLLVLPEETKVYTGHGPTTTIGTEKQFNQYLQ
jgi:glyoxylase-like metal-dependent hydrolase (beta-lactamase superfamily II)